MGPRPAAALPTAVAGTVVVPARRRLQRRRLLLAHPRPDRLHSHPRLCPRLPGRTPHPAHPGRRQPRRLLVHPHPDDRLQLDPRRPDGRGRTRRARRAPDGVDAVRGGRRVRRRRRLLPARPGVDPALGGRREPAHPRQRPAGRGLPHGRRGRTGGRGRGDRADPGAGRVPGRRGLLRPVRLVRVPHPAPDPHGPGTEEDGHRAALPRRPHPRGRRLHPARPAAADRRRSRHRRQLLLRRALHGRLRHPRRPGAARRLRDPGRAQRLPRRRRDARHARGRHAGRQAPGRAAGGRPGRLAGRRDGRAGAGAQHPRGRRDRPGHGLRHRLPGGVRAQLDPAQHPRGRAQPGHLRRHGPRLRGGPALPDRVRRARPDRHVRPLRPGRRRARPHGTRGAGVQGGARDALRAFLPDQVGPGQRNLPVGPSGVWCVQMQGGGGSRRDGGAPARAKPSVGESATDDNAADVRARLRDPDKIRKTGPNPPAGRPTGRTGPRGWPPPSW
ncbi:hypothetical protein SGPA1_40940 [Streptomyces misionensis JCM 4497]